MRRRMRRGIGIVLSLGMVFSAIFTGGIDTGCKTGTLAAADNGAAGIDMTDETGYIYTLYEESTGDGTSMQKAEITGYTGTETDLVIPQKVGQYEVGRIGKEAFRETEITGVVIPEGIDTIGYQAFRGCGQLRKVQIPSTITEWKEESYNNSAFEDCTALTELELAEDLTILGQRAFAGCTSLAGVRIPPGIEIFRNQVFSDCTGLTELELAEGISQIGYQAFSGCTSLEEVTVPSTVKSWATLRANGIMATVYDCGAFKGCTALRKVTLTEGLTTLYGFQGVRDCPLITELDVPASVEDVSYAFAGCKYLEKVTLHEGIKTIGLNAFYDCTSLSEVTIPNTVTFVDGGAFKQCTSLESLVLPPGAASLGSSITSGCSNLKEIHILAESVNWYQKLDLSKTGKIYCLEGSGTYDTYLAGMGSADGLALLPAVTGIRTEGYSGVYDGAAHGAVTLDGNLEGDGVLYRLGTEGGFSTELPEITEPGTYTVEICVKRTAAEGALQASLWKAQSVITKKSCSIQLKDMEVSGSDYTVTPESYTGEAELVYTYYMDEELKEICRERPTAPGVYYVKATAEESKHYLAGESNVVKLTLRKDSDPGTEPGTNPGSDSGVAPGNQTTTNPGASAGTSPGSTSGKKKVSVRKVSLKKVKSPAKKKMEVRWKKISGVTGYQVRAGLNKKTTRGKKVVGVRGAGKTKVTLKKLKRKKYYYVKVRAYKTVKGTRYYGNWSTVKKVKVK